MATVLAQAEMAARDRGASSFRVGEFEVPLLEAAHLAAISFYGRLGKDQHGQSLIAEQEALFARFRRQGVDFDEDELIIVFGAIDDERAEKQAADYKDMKDKMPKGKHR